MYNKISKMMKRGNKGFTLVELMVVVVIIGILVAIAIPVYNNATSSATVNAAKATVAALNGAVSVYIANEATKSADITSGTDKAKAVDALVAANYIQAVPGNLTDAKITFVGSATNPHFVYTP